MKLKKLLDEFEEIDDVFLFGSFVKGAMNPNDVDVAIILKIQDNISKIKSDIKKIIPTADIQIISSIYDPLWIVMMREGYSIRKDKFLFEIYKLSPVVLYHYSLKKLNPVKKVQFDRGMKNFLKDSDSKIISRSVVLIPMERKADFDMFLESWNIKYDSKEYELFPVLRKENFI